MTQKEISQKTGLSISTVQRALANPMSVKSSTRELINKFLTNKTGLCSIKTIVILLPTIHSDFYADILLGIYEQAKLYDIHIEIVITKADKQKEVEFFKNYQQRNNQAIILLSFSHTSLDDLIQDAWYTPIIIIDEDTDFSLINAKILINNRELVADATSILLKDNPKKIALLTGPQRSRTANERKEGFIRVCQQNGLSSKDYEIHHVEYHDFEAAKTVACKILDNINITSVLCCNRTLTKGFIFATELKCKNIPKDIAFIGFDYFTELKLLVTSLSMIKIPTYNMGKTAIEVLLKPEIGKQIYLFSGHIILKGSESRTHS